MKKHFRSFAEFYPYYLSEHRHPVCRGLHNIGSVLVLVVGTVSVLTRRWPLLLTLPLVGYGFAWIGHFFFEKNQPATFRNPIYSFIGDWVMLRDVLLGRIKLYQRES